MVLHRIFKSISYRILLLYKDVELNEISYQALYVKGSFVSKNNQLHG